MTDSLPKHAIGQLNRKRQELMKEIQLDPNGDWKESLAKLTPALRSQLHLSFFPAWDEELDNAAGACVLCEPGRCSGRRCSGIPENCLFNDFLESN